MNFIKKFNIEFTLILICILLSACGPSPEELAATSAAEVAAAATSTPTLTPSSTPMPKSTDTPVPSDTPQPTLTYTPAPEIVAGPDRPQFLLIPARNNLVEIWNGIPVMQEAIAGLEEYGGFYYSIESTITEVRDYYQMELGKSGWSLSAVGESENGDIKLIFQNSGDQVFITVFGFDTDFEDPLWGFQAPASAVLIVY